MNPAPEVVDPTDASQRATTIRVLLVEDHPEAASQVVGLLTAERSVRYDIDCAPTLRACMERLRIHPPDIVLLDLTVIDGAGLSNVDQIRAITPATPIIVLSGIDDERVAVEAVHEGAQDYLVRSQLNPQLLGRSIRYAIERQRFESELLEAQERYRGIFEHIVEGIFQTTPDGRYLSANPSLARIYGYASAEELVESVTNIAKGLYVDPHQRERFVAIMEEHDIVRGFESQIHRKDGSIIWISENVRAIRDAAGNLLCYEGTVQDITAERDAQEQLRRSEALYHSLVENLPQNIFRKDVEGRFTFASNSFARTIGRSAREIVGKTDFDFYPEKLARQYHEDDLRVMREGKPYETVEVNQPPGGETYYVQVVKTPLKDETGRVIGLQGIFWDITEKKMAEERERRAQAELATNREELRSQNEQMEQDIKMAREIQLAILPQQYPAFPTDPTQGPSALRFAHHYSPSGTVGGDFFHVLPLSPTSAAIFICDVMGHGVRSALITTMIRALVEELTPRCHDPGQLLTLLNRDLRSILKQSGSPLFTTAFCIFLDLTTGEGRFACAGHPKQILLRDHGKAAEFLGHTPKLKKAPLGLVDGTEYSSNPMRMEPGDRVLLYTDGLFEVEGADGELFSVEHLRDTARTQGSIPLDQLILWLVQEVRSYAVTGSFDDDVCLLAFELTRLIPANTTGTTDI